MTAPATEMRAQEVPRLERQAERLYWMAWFLTLIVAALEIAGAMASGSLALMSDVGHLMSDTVLALLPISGMRALRAGRMSHRLDRLISVIAACLLLWIGLHIIREAGLGLRHDSGRQVRGWVLFLFAIGAAATNFWQHRLLSRVSSLHRHAAHRALHFHVLSDFAKNLLLPLTGLLIGMGWADSRVDLAVALSIGGVVVMRALLLVKESLRSLRPEAAAVPLRQP